MTVQKRDREAGQAVAIMILGLTFFLFAAVGIGIDGSHLYAQRQMAQAAADAAAQAGIHSMFIGTTTGATYGASGPYTSPAAYTCTSSDTTPSCKYATLNGFTPSNSTDSVTLQFGSNTTSGAPLVSLASNATTPVSWMTATVTRNVSTFLMRLIGPTLTTVTATGTAAIVNTKSALPIVVLHPTLSGSFSKNGSNDVIICGGPSQSIQVDSSDTGAVSVSGNSGHINLQHAGPLDPGNCTAGTGADFDNHGGPSSSAGLGLQLGSLPGLYVPGSYSLADPLLSMPAPPNSIKTTPSQVGGSISAAGGSAQANAWGCDPTLPSNVNCYLYHPGYYASGIQLGASNKAFAVFEPGIYYIGNGGFQLGSNSIVRMANATAGNSPDTITSTGWTQGMLIYNSPQSPVNASNDVLSISANAGQINNNVYPNSTQCGTDPLTGNALGGNCLVGASGGVITAGAGGTCPTTATLNAMYYGALFFQDHSVSKDLTHSVNGGGGLTIVGTLYASSINSGSHYQSLQVQGNGGSTTTLQGQIIVDALSLGGTSAIAMNLSGLPCYITRRIALVQ